ncbi:MAG: bifunctional UDP-N-acetylglucosamine diphosphorylase/glucosamine-1-phosphate N-acetyltransferase GlmU [Burkholderiaceae bacterium]|nr:bifunctional UDP-N-acetylglucosamine diphosphorylase/glucosamine-1-phosphate N-acetyltransferase GlmU [Burkholderiaceae bacterium]MCD8515825.1 bifunctional UDP-N-acetylglucosamine diphosphorylase/glucosamine-1-phosphate N-acetyltransferase GlmU [Burkholderiaceae bacterium]MCD8536175.1 bifunctional UDP-N-acetylglucosamine diphosphorylase/glucosamine-1-phosphate N-acetyltransferase GlmU [Burkholderiaceae bacterium]MCD8565039.1 bifunctional UDP-N-acetylglucosamine diphosphorylase/glucosamine-1-p
MLNVVILAAGMGKRMQSSQPKVLQTIGGQPMLTRVINTARSLSPDQLIVVVGHGEQAIRQAYDGQVDIHFVSQWPQLGTGHAVAQAVDLLKSSRENNATMVLYGDVPLVQTDTLQALLAGSDNGLALLTEEVENPHGYGRIVRDAQNRVLTIVEEKDATAAQKQIREINTGMMVAPTDKLKSWLKKLSNNNAQGEYYLTDIVEFAAKDKVTINTVAPKASFETQGVNSRVQQAQLERLWQRELAARQLQGGVAIADPDRFDQRGELMCGQDVFIDVGCVFEGMVVLGDGVRIGAHCVLKDVTVGAGTEIHPFSHLQQADIGKGAQIGPYARIRPGTRLEDEVHIGNFVEIKNSHIQSQSKANHLAYVGDADVGSRVNIGAGTITCNYDGANKHRTVIEDDAFIGSDTQLVAPVRVGKGATLGAGTTLTQDAPANKLTVSRSPQKTIENWQRPVKPSRKKP